MEIDRMGNENVEEHDHLSPAGRDDQDQHDSQGRRLRRRLNNQGFEAGGGTLTPNTNTTDKTEAGGSSPTGSPYYYDQPHVMSQFNCNSNVDMQRSQVQECSTMIKRDVSDRIRATVAYQFDMEIMLKVREIQLLQFELERAGHLVGYLKMALAHEFCLANQIGTSGGSAAAAVMPAITSSGRKSAPPSGIRSISVDSSSVAASLLHPLDDLYEQNGSSSSYLPSTSSESDGDYYYLPGSQPQSSASSKVPSSSRNTPLPSSAGNSASSSPATTSTVNPQSTSKNAPQYQYDYKSDGTLVRLQCPSCKEARFRSMLGFLNHCRMHCKVAFENQEDRLERCGIPVDPGDVPPGFFFRKHPTQVKQERELARVRSEFVPSRPDVLVTPRINQYPLMDASSLTSSASTIQQNGTSDVAPILDRIRDAFRIDRAGRPCKFKVGMEQIVLTPSAIDASQTMGDTSDTATSQISVNSYLTAPAISTSTSSTTNLRSVTPASRFFTKKQVIIGNVAKLICNPATITSETRGSVPTHRWKLYLKEVPLKISKKNNSPGLSDLTDESGDASTSCSNSDLHRIIRCVRFHLHPCFRPNDIHEVTAPPYEISESSWGEFPIHVEVHFVDSKRNRPQTFVHNLRLFTAISGKYSKPSERIVDLEIDRRTFLRDASEPPPLRQVITSSSEDPETVDDYGMSRELLQELKTCLHRFPLVLGFDSNKSKRNWLGIKHESFDRLDDYYAADPEKRDRITHARSKFIWEHILSRFPAFVMSVEDITEWAFKHDPNLQIPLPTTSTSAPSDAEISASASQQEVAITLPAVLTAKEMCRYCGRAAINPKITCKCKPRKKHLTSKSSPTALFENSSPMHTSEISDSTTGPDDVIRIPLPKTDMKSYLETMFPCSLLHASDVMSSGNGMSRDSVNAVSAALRIFLHDIIQTGLNQLDKSRHSASMSVAATQTFALQRRRVLTPVHIYNPTIGTTPSLSRFDFLSGAYTSLADQNSASQLQKELALLSQSAIQEIGMSESASEQPNTQPDDSAGQDSQMDRN